MMSMADQRTMYKGLPAASKVAVKKQCQMCAMSGDGIKDVLVKIREVLGPAAKELSQRVLKEIVVPLIVKYVKSKAGMDGTGHCGGSLGIAGGTLVPAGGSLGIAGGTLTPAGAGLRLAGQRGMGKAPKMVKGSQEAKDHMAKLRAMRKK